MRTCIDQKIYTRFDEGKNLPELCVNLLSEQKKAWLDLRIGCGSLKDIRERDVPCKGFSVRLQYNPGRIKSSTAEVSREKINERQCFLCLDHLPQDQKGILYRNEFLILCNPMPVFPSHFTVSHLDHRHQAIVEPIGTLLQLVKDFGPGWMILYNGPKCGASAPDHLHFQVAPSGQMPIEEEIKEGKRLKLIKEIDSNLLYHMKDLGREVMIMDGNDPMAMEVFFRKFLKALGNVLQKDEEPMINIAAFYKERKWRLVIFLRQKHRPDIFFKEGEDRMVISPGAIDMGGLLITPVERDFNRLDEALVVSVYEEVSLGKKIIERAIEVMG
jgi:ATP adenylyltransferase/5',5'''-P-1,P-4-tetraphosphate phosphorylase II